MTEALAETSVDDTNEALAFVEGKAWLKLPQDLYIPPDHLELMLEIFSGPMDLLLYLIRKQNLDILDIPVAEVVHQYMNYIDIMRSMRFELASEYLEMAAMLTEIKSRMLLPRSKEVAEEEDPRVELVRRLQEYEKIKTAASELDELPRRDRDIFVAQVSTDNIEVERPESYASMADLMAAFKSILQRVDLTTSHNIERETISVRERMSRILSTLSRDDFVIFHKFFNVAEGKLGVVVTFLAILEMVKDKLIEIVQAEPFKPIYLRRASC